MSLLLSRRATLVGAVSLAAAPMVPQPAAAAGTIPRRSGLPWASGCFSALDELAGLRGRQMDVNHLYLGRGSWADIAAAKGLGGNSGRQETIMVSYPMFPNNFNPKTAGAGVWRRGANGEFDSYHRSASVNLARANRPLILRIGWEWNNRAFPWSCISTADSGAYRSYFQRIVTALRSSIGNCWIDWSCDKEGRTSNDSRQWYPGDGYVDFIGPNQYDFWPAATSEAIWNGNVGSRTKTGGPKGLGAWLAYARERGKKLSVGEWGLIPTARGGGGDNAVFMANILELFAENANSIGYECYFNRNTPSFRHRLLDYPKAAQKYGQVLRSL